MNDSVYMILLSYLSHTDQWAD